VLVMPSGPGGDWRGLAIPHRSTVSCVNRCGVHAVGVDRGTGADDRSSTLAIRTRCFGCVALAVRALLVFWAISSELEFVRAFWIWAFWGSSGNLKPLGPRILVPVSNAGPRLRSFGSWGGGSHSAGSRLRGLWLYWAPLTVLALVLHDGQPGPDVGVLVPVGVTVLGLSICAGSWLRLGCGAAGVLVSAHSLTGPKLRDFVRRLWWDGWRWCDGCGVRLFWHQRDLRLVPLPESWAIRRIPSSLAAPVQSSWRCGVSAVGSAVSWLLIALVCYVWERGRAFVVVMRLVSESRDLHAMEGRMCVGGKDGSIGPRLWHERYRPSRLGAPQFRVRRCG
jgi:hypothetical protein